MALLRPRLGTMMPLRRGRPHHQPWALCRVPDGRGRHSARSVRRHSADDRGTATAASHINRVMRSFVTHPSQAHGCASMTENSVIFNARHGAGSFHPDRQLALTAQDWLKRGNGANWRTTRQLSGECRIRPVSRVYIRILGTLETALYRRR